MTLEPPSRAAALQVSSSLKESEVTDQDMLDFFEGMAGQGTTPTSLELAGVPAIAWSEHRDGVHLLGWLARSGRRLLLLTHTSEHSQPGDDQQAVRGILASLEVG